MKKMKNIYSICFLLMAGLMGSLLYSCDDESSSVNYNDDNAYPPPVVTLTSPSTINSIELGQSVNIAGSIATSMGIRDMYFIQLANTTEGLKEIGTKTYLKINRIVKDTTFTIDIKITDKTTAAIAMVATDVFTKKTEHKVDIKEVIVVNKDVAYIYKNVELAPEYERTTNPGQPYLFSTKGVTVNGVLKNVLTLAESKASGGSGVDFAFINIWKNTQTDPPTASSRLGIRGYTFCDVSQLGRGPVGRQCDLEWFPKSDTCCMMLIPPATAQAFGLDALFQNAKADSEAVSQALNQLSGMGMKVGTNYYVNKLNGASADRTDALSENLKAGSYIAIRRENNKDFKYGVIQIVDPGNDSDTKDETGRIIGDDYTKWYTGPGLSGYTYNGVAKLYGRKCKFNIIVQK